MSEHDPSPGNEPGPTLSRARARVLLAALVLGYIGVYLCRKNFSVAVPLIREAFSLSKEQIGIVASASTLAYMIGKFTFGPLIDRFGGRTSLLLAMLAVAVFGAAGGLVGTLPLLTLVYSLNRLAGSAGWGAMVKLVPDWFAGRHLPLAMAVLSLSFVFGGVCATLLAGEIAARSGNDWRWVMSGPSLVLGAILVLCWAVLPRPAAAPRSRTGAADPSKAAEAFAFRKIGELLRIRQFWVVCALSFTLTLLRETFNTWTVDFFKEAGGAEMSNRIAAFLSTPFDALGAVGIVLLGWVFGRTTPGARKRLLFALLLALAGLIFLLPGLARHHLLAATAAVGAIGFLAYGPYSLLAGILAVEIRGKAYVATVAGMVDGVGYLAAILAGQQFGRILDLGGYDLGFACLAGLAAASAGLCLFLYGGRQMEDLRRRHEN
jgi:sugar phosphate permease